MSAPRPNSYVEFVALQGVGRTHCLQCKQPFTPKNVHTPLGWRETQISGFCETCFDALFNDDEEVGNDDDE